ncbi:MAG: 50S ribosomal protein L29 [Planctomycetota bacterium]
MNANELREMSDEQLVDTLNDTCKSFFRLKIQAQTERLDAPSELRRHRRLIARIKTVQGERSKAADSAPAAAATAETEQAKS